MIKVISYSSDRDGVLVDADMAIAESKAQDSRNVLVLYKDKIPVAWFSNWAYAYKIDSVRKPE